MNKNSIVFKSAIGRFAVVFFIFSILFLICLKTRVNAQMCANCGETLRRRVNISRLETTDYWETFYPPADIVGPNIWIFGAEIRFHDFGGDWDYYARAKVIDYDDYSTSYTTNLSNSCVGRSPNSRACGGATPCVDVCSPNEYNLHKIYLNNWKTNHQSILEIYFRWWRDLTPNEGLYIEAITWVYSICSFGPCPSMKPPQVSVNDVGYACYIEGQGPNIPIYFDIIEDSTVNPQGLFAIDKFRIKISSQRLNFTAYEDWTLHDPAPGDGTCEIKSDFLNGYYSYPGGNSTGDTPMLSLINLRRFSPCPGTTYHGEATVIFASILSNIPSIESDDWIFSIQAWNVNGDSDFGSSSIQLSEISSPLQFTATETGTGEITLQYSYTLSPGLFVSFDGIILRCYRMPGSLSGAFAECMNAAPVYGTILPNGWYDQSYSNSYTVTGGVPGVTYRFELEFTHNCGQTTKIQEVTVSTPSEGGDSWMMTTYGDTFSNGGYSDLTMRRVTSSEVPASIKGTAVDDNAAFFSTYIISKNVGKWTSNNISFQEPDYLLGNYQDKNTEKFQTEGDLYGYLYSLYQSNKSSCETSVQVHENEPLGASCSGKNLYFYSDSDITLGEGWNQQPSVDNACLIVSKKNVTIPPTVTNTDAFLLSEGNVVTQAQEVSSGGSGVPEDLEPTYVMQYLDMKGGFIDTIKSVDDIPVIAYTNQAEYNNIFGMYISRCSDSDCTSIGSTSQQLGSKNVEMDLELMSNGNPIFIFAFSNGTSRILRFYKCGSPTCTPNSQNSSYNLDTYVYDPASMTLDRQGRPTIVYTYKYSTFNNITYQYDNNYRLKFIRCGDQDCSQTVNPNTKRTLIQFDFSHTLGTPVEYDPHVVYVRNTLGQIRPLLIYKGGWTYNASRGWYDTRLKVRDCVDMTCGTLGPERQLNIRAGYFNDLIDVKVGPDGIPYILYQVRTTSIPYSETDVIIKCADSTCTSSANGTGTVLINAASQIDDIISDFEIDSNGNPTYAYIHPTKYTYMIKCYTNTCSSKRQIQLPDSAYKDMDVILDNDSRPLFVYSTLDGIKKVKCSSIDCQLSIGGNDTMLVMNGGVISGNINFNRSLPDNLNNPAEIFWYDPKYLDIFRDCLGEPYSFKIREYNYVSRN